MKSRSLVIHGALAVIALAAAYLAWLHERREAEGDDAEEPEIVIAEISPDDIKSVTFRSKRRTVVITPAPENIKQTAEATYGKKD